MSFDCKLRCSAVGHEQDVRALAAANFPQGGFVSGSRDVTARVWVPNEDNNGFREGLVLGGHNGFVSAVCVLPPDDEYPQGLIVTGSNDHNIHAYTLDSPEPRYRLTGHSENICALAAGKFGSLVSGSWDKTARVWLKQKCVMTLQGHEAAVWGVAIMPEGGFMITASADKTLRLWKAGKSERTYIGHTDCVRGVTVLNAAEFLSCSNDTTIRRWSVHGTACLQTYSGHTSFIYAICAFPNGTDFVSCGEDRTMRVWRDGALRQTVVHPAQSVWSICILPNGDIATGASDAVIRVFTFCSERFAPVDELQTYEASLASTDIPAQIGDIKTEDLVGPAALQVPGKRDGQTLMVRQTNCIEAYQWSASDSRWIKIGNVVGGSSDPQAPAGGSSNKTHFQGKDYDYVFNVEIYEDKPALKLPYNVGEDPYVAAHNFLERNDISQMFLDQVANFILAQTAGITLGSAAPVVSDPFTGGGRYIPGSAGGEPPGPSSRADPFTGSNRYVPGGMADPLTGGSSYQPVVMAAASVYFPETTYIKFEQCQSAPLFAKLREFNLQTDVSQQFKDADISSLENFVNGKQQISPALLEMLWHMMQWPAGVVFPVLDIFRLALRDATANEHYCAANKGGPHLISYAFAVFDAASKAGQPKNFLLMLRALCNAFQHPPGERLMLEAGEKLLAAARIAMNAGADKLTQVALSSFVLNLAIGYGRALSNDGRQRCLLVASDMAPFLEDPEAHFRLLVAMGTAVAGSTELMELARSLEVGSYLNKVRESTSSEKVRECALQLQAMMSR